MPDDLAAFFFRFNVIFGINGQNIGITASGRCGRRGGLRSSFNICGFRFFFSGWGIFRIFFKQKRIQSIFAAAVKMCRSAAVQFLQNAVIFCVPGCFARNGDRVCGISRTLCIRLVFYNICCAAHIAGDEIIF